MDHYPTNMPYFPAMEKIQKAPLFLLLQIATASVFIGRAWQHLFWDAPYRDLLWDEELMSPLVSRILGLTWKEFVANPAMDQQIQLIIKAHGFFYLLCAIAVFLIARFPKLVYTLMVLGGLSLFFLAFLEYKERFSYLGQWLEYTLQWASPFFLVVAHYQKGISKQLTLFLKIATAITFSSHGLYAVGFYPFPGGFSEMVINILHVNDTQAITFLKVVGVIDFVLSALIFIPHRKTQQAALAYAVFWGLTTTFARLFAYFHWEFAGNWFLQWLHEMIFRFPHFLIPLLLLLKLRQTGAATSPSE